LIICNISQITQQTGQFSGKTLARDHSQHLCEAESKLLWLQWDTYQVLATHIHSNKGIFIIFIYHSLPSLCLNACSTISEELINTFSLFVVAQREQLLESLNLRLNVKGPCSKGNANIEETVCIYTYALALVDAEVPKQVARKEEGKQTR